MSYINEALTTAARLAEQIAKSSETESFICELADLIAHAFSSNNKVIICGNGGSAADAMHFAEEFTGRFRKDRPALPVLALTDPTHITCVGNDYGFDEIFSRGVEAWGNLGDVFIGLTTSGNSQNIINACDAAIQKGMTSVLLLGKDGGRLLNKADVQLIVPGATSDRIQELHMMILHITIEQVERIMFKENYQS